MQEGRFLLRNGIIRLMGTVSRDIADNESRKIQVLRGLAIISVVIIHNTPGGAYQIFFRPFVNFGVAMFLFLSGYLTRSGKWNPLKRIKKILIPYVLWTLIYVVLLNLSDPARIITEIIPRLILADARGMMYFVPVYIKLTLLIPFMDHLARSRYRLAALLISPVAILILRVIPMLLGLELSEGFSAIVETACSGWFIYFYLGYLIANGFIKTDIRTPKLAIYMVIGLILQICEALFYSLGGVYNCGTQAKLSVVFTNVIICLLACRYIRSASAPAPKVLQIIGNCSFGIFFSHFLLIHLAVLLSGYIPVLMFPFNAVQILLYSFIFVFVCGKVLRRTGRYLALDNSSPKTK